MIRLARSWVRATDFRTILNIEFESRQRRRPSYSRRAFARDIDMKYTTLHDVLKGRYGISSSLACQIALNLQFGKEQTEYFVELVKSQHARSKHERETSLARLDEIRLTVPEPLDDTTVNMLKRWYYPAILELITLKMEPLSPKQISQILGIAESEVASAIDVLFELEVVKNEDGAVVRTSTHLFGARKVQSPIIRSFHKQILTKAADAIDKVPIERRKNLSVVFSFYSNKAEAARGRLEEMQREFIREFQTEVDSDSIYTLAIQMFPLGYFSSNSKS